MSQYGREASEEVERAMHERNDGTLKIGRSNRLVKSRAQAIAIGLAKARKEGGKVPNPSASESAAKQAAAGKAAANKAVAKKSASKATGSTKAKAIKTATRKKSVKKTSSKT